MSTQAVAEPLLPIKALSSEPFTRHTHMLPGRPTIHSLARPASTAERNTEAF
jgi:hypothetical protein